MAGDTSKSGREEDVRIAVEVKALQAGGRLAEAREKFSELVSGINDARSG